MNQGFCAQKVQFLLFPVVVHVLHVVVVLEHVERKTLDFQWFMASFSVVILLMCVTTGASIKSITETRRKIKRQKKKAMRLTHSLFNSAKKLMLYYKINILSLYSLLAQLFVVRLNFYNIRFNLAYIFLYFIKLTIIFCYYISKFSIILISFFNDIL